MGDEFCCTNSSEDEEESSDRTFHGLFEDPLACTGMGTVPGSLGTTQGTPEEAAGRQGARRNRIGCKVGRD